MVNTYLAVYSWGCLVGCLYGIPLCSFVIYKLVTSPNLQLFMICIIAAIMFSYTLTLIEMCFIVTRNLSALGAFDYIGMVSLICWYFACWTLCFKYWQTAYEINFLFRLKTEQLVQHHKRIYIAVNVFGYGLNSLPIIMKTVCTNDANFWWMLLAYVGELYIIGFFIGAVRRIRTVMK